MEDDEIKLWSSHFLPKIRDFLSISSDDSKFLEQYKHIGLRNQITQSQVFESLPVFTSKRTVRGALVFGAGNNLETHVQYLQLSHLGQVLLISADGATKFLLENAIYPDIMFTDLDGGLDLVYEAAQRGVTVFVLIHPDNIGLFNDFIEGLLVGLFVFCTQDIPKYGFVNTFGFTDGDRAVSFAILSGLKTLTLGFDLKGSPGVFSILSKTVNEPFLLKKRKKLRVAANILSYLSEKYKNLYTLDQNLAPGISLEGETISFRISKFLSLI